MSNLRRLFGRPDHSLNAPVRMDGEGEWQEWLVDEGDSQETMLAESQELGRRQKLLDRALKLLNPRERRILSERRLKDEPTTLEDLSKEFGISRERVRQIEVRAFDKVQRAIRNAALDEKLAAN
jgi:RNA polymerase sigma-32 factor